MSKRRRVLLWIGVLVLLTAAGTSGLRLFLVAPDHVTKEKFALLRIGMVKDEVDTILGPTAPIAILKQIEQFEVIEEIRDLPGEDHSTPMWVGRDYAITVFYDTGTRKVWGMQLSTPVFREGSLTGRLRRWLGL